MYQLVCEVQPILDTLTCPTGWHVAPVNNIDLAQLVNLLSFDYATFASLLGTCIVLFITGHSAGHVARNLGRV